MSSSPTTFATRWASVFARCGVCAVIVAMHGCDRNPSPPPRALDTEARQVELRDELQVEGGAEYCGEFGEGDLVRRTVTLKNCGGQAVRLRVLAASCGCVNAELEQTELNPGEKTKLTVSTHALAGQMNPLVQHWAALGVFPGQATEPAVVEQIPLNFRVNRDWRVLPGIMYAISQVGESIVLEAYVQSASGEAIPAVHVDQCSIPYLKASTERISESVWRIIVTGTVREIGELRGTLPMEIVYPRGSKVRLPISICGMSRVTFDPSGVAITPSGIGQMRVVRVRLFGSEGAMLTARVWPPTIGVRAILSADGFMDVVFDGTLNDDYGGSIELCLRDGTVIGRLPLSVLSQRAP